MSQKQSFLELPFIFDIEKLKEDLNCVNHDEWVKHPNTQAYDGEWLITSLTSTTGETRNIVANENQEYKDTPLLQKTKYIKSVIDTFKTKVEAVRFMNLKANSIIKPHCDKGSSFEEGYARLHIPITSNDEVKFILSGVDYKMELGKCYYIDAHNTHSVINRGTSHRVHLLIDCHVNDWLKEIFLKGGFKEPIYKYGDKNITDDNVGEMITSFETMNTEISLKMAKRLKKIRDKNMEELFDGKLTQNQKNKYLTKGFTSITKGISDELLYRLQNMAEKFENDIIQKYKKGMSTFNACISNEKLIRYNNIIGIDYDTTLDLLASPSMMAVFRDICGKGAVPLMVDLLYKQPSSDSVVLWHQDALHSRNYPYINVGIYLDDANEDNGCLQCVINSQNEKQDISKLEHEFGWNIPNTVKLAAKEGDINIHDVMVLHGSQPKKTKNPRRTIYVEIRPYDAIIEDNMQSKEWAELRKRFMGLVLRRANPLDWPEEWKADYPSDLKSDKEEIENIFKRTEKIISANYAFPSVNKKGYPIPENYNELL